MSGENPLGKSASNYLVFLGSLPSSLIKKAICSLIKGNKGGVMNRTREISKVLVEGGIILISLFILIGYANAQSCVPPPEGIISWWPGDGNALDIVYDNDGTLQNGVTFAPGKVGQAFSFDGLDDYVSVADDISLRAIGAITIDFWAKFNNPYQNEMSPLEKLNDYVVIWNGINKTLEFHLTDACDMLYHLGAYVSLPSLNVEEFHHYAITAKDNGSGGPEFHIFVDGVEQTAVPNNDPPHFGCGWFQGVTGTLSIGKRTHPESAPMFFNGQIDELEIFSRALSASEIQAIFNAGSAGKCKPGYLLEVSIDIHPGSFPNSINIKSKGKIPVAILGTETFDAKTVDPTTVRFGKTGTEAAPVHSALEDVNADGNMDMILHFKTQDTGIRCGDSSASLTGETLSDQALEGSDPIRTVGCK
jgi:hypothetical protein